MVKPPATRKHKQGDSPALAWPDDTDLLGLALELQPQQDITFPPQYTTEFHSWFLDQVRRVNFELSTYLHDQQSEKPFTVSSLSSLIKSQGQSSRGVATPKLLLSANQTYEWTITALSQPVVAWMRQWLQTPPADINLRSGSLRILNWAVAHPPTTYNQLLQVAIPDRPTVILSFLSPTSFRHKGNHLPLPVPENVFHSYLRRWNDFSSRTFDQDAFLEWVDQSVVILRHQLQSTKVMAGKRGSVTGFTGAVQFGLSPTAHKQPEFVQLFTALGQLAPYCGTGHKTTFGLGQTRLGWSGTNTVRIDSKPCWVWQKLISPIWFHCLCALVFLNGTSTLAF